MAQAKLLHSKLDLTLYAEQSQTLQQMQQFTAVLQQRLQHQGIEVAPIKTSLGKISDPETATSINSLLQITV